MEINAEVFYDYHVFQSTGERVPMFAEIETLIPQHFKTLEEAEAFAALWPAGLKMRAYTCGSLHGPSYGVSMKSVRLLTDGVNGGKNEAGIKRLQQFVRAAAKLGVTVTSNGRATNRFDTFEEGMKEVVK